MGSLRLVWWAAWCDATIYAPGSGYDIRVETNNSDIGGFRTVMKRRMADIREDWQKLAEENARVVYNASVVAVDRGGVRFDPEAFFDNAWDKQCACAAVLSDGRSVPVYAFLHGFANDPAKIRMLKTGAGLVLAVSTNLYTETSR